MSTRMMKIAWGAGVLLVFGIAATLALGAQVGSEGQVATFEAKLSPGALPRDRLAPIKIRVEGEFQATPENHLAQLVSIEIGVNRHGQMFTDGLPTCRYQQLVATDSSTALKVCGDAQVGHGILTATTAFAEQKRTHSKAKILAFNGRQPGGGTVIFLHINGHSPGPFTVVIPIKVRRTQGTFGTTFFAVMPGYARRWAYLTKFRFVIGRHFKVDGHDQSFLMASCPAPKGLNGAVFPFARSVYRFLTTKTLRTTLVGGCHVRKERRLPAILGSDPEAGER
jgi:hypothetical protein